MHEYKVVPAPSRAVKVRGLKTTEDRFAHALAEVLNATARDGWEYLRSETLPCTERKGFTGTRTTNQVVLIFRRPVTPAEKPEAAPPLDWADLGDLHATDAEAPARRAEPVFRPGAMSRTGAGRGDPPLRAGPDPSEDR